jgi:hypothetical protein
MDVKILREYRGEACEFGDVFDWKAGGDVVFGE